LGTLSTIGGYPLNQKGGNHLGDGKEISISKMRIFFASDLHGSEDCLNKFINAARFYKTDALVLGGDLSGKAIVPVVEESAGQCRASFMGRDFLFQTARELADIERRARKAGYYLKQMTAQEFASLQRKPAEMERIFSDLIKDSLERWLAFAEDRLPVDVECYVMPGNDDLPVVEQVLNSSNRVVNCDKKKVIVKGQFEMLSLGYSNRTPFNSPRELDDNELARMIQDLMDGVNYPNRAIFNLHCPPYGTSLDFVPEIDENLRLRTRMGSPQMVHRGSVAVREAIITFQPMLGLHGHCHESRGIERLGRTICFNPGSEYSSGTLKGIVVDIFGHGTDINYQFVSA
jgi:Icc-related predicted phosphoesterase